MSNKLLQKNKILYKILTPKFLFLTTFILLNIYLVYSTYITNSNKENYFRVHVVANSDSIKDQLLKYKVADKVDTYLSMLFNNTNMDKATCKKTIEENIQNILEICDAEIASSDSNYPVYANIRQHVL